MLNLKKLENIAYLSFKNAQRLHRDAIILYKERRYPSAFYLSILAQEEIGKMHMISEFVESWRNDGPMEELEENWLNLLYQHPHKQGSFVRYSPLGWSSMRGLSGLKLMKEVFDGALEAKKQGSVYVGLKRRGRKVDMKGKIIHPFQVGKKMAQNQITKINDYFLVLGIRIKYGQSYIDGGRIDSELKNKGFLKTTLAVWATQSNSAIRHIQSIQEFFHKKTLPL